MVPSSATGLRVLVVEDEYYLADDVRTALADAGAEVMGPVATVADATAMIEGDASLDAVLLDINLRGKAAYDVADTLRARNIPFAFVTGYDRAALPPRFSETTSLRKPVRATDLVRLLETLTATQGGGTA